MTLDQLRYALELQRTRQFSKAAEACNITQPSLSVQIAKLEGELGGALFVRTRSGIEITEFGEVLLKQARQAVDSAEGILELAHELKGRIQGSFRLGIISTLAPTLLPLFVRDFGQKFPQVDLSVTEDRTANLVANLDNGTLDAAILSTPQKCPEPLMERVLFYEPFVVFSSPGQPILARNEVALNQISAKDILLLDETHCLRDQVLQLCKMKKAIDQHGLKIQSASMQTLIEIIRTGPGYTLLPALSASSLPQAERQKMTRQLERPTPCRKVSLVYHRSRVKKAIVESLKETIVDHLPEDVFKVSKKDGLRVLNPGPEHFEI